MLSILHVPVGQLYVFFSIFSSIFSLFSSSIHFLIGLLFFFILSCMSCLYVESKKKTGTDERYLQGRNRDADTEKG